MFFPESHICTLTFQTADGHALYELLLHADVEYQGRQHDHDETGVLRAVVRRGLLRLHQVQQATGSVLAPVAELMRVMEMMYSFQKERKLKRIMVTMEGWAMGKMMLIIVRP